MLIFNNHHEVLGYWRKIGFNEAPIIHIDAHHDIYRKRPFAWIDNYLLYAIDENITKEIFLVVPNLFFKSGRINAYVYGIFGFSELIKEEDDFYNVISKSIDAIIHVCSLEKLIRTIYNINNCIVDIDTDFFIYNGLGNFVNKVASYALDRDFLFNLTFLKRIIEKTSPVAITVSRSEFKSYTPYEYQFIVKLIDRYITQSIDICSLWSVLVDSVNKREIIEDIEQVPQFLFDDIHYYNACISLSHDDIDSSIKHVNQMSSPIPVSKNIACCEYYLYKGDRLGALREAQKFNVFLNNEYLYLYHQALIQYYYKNYKSVINLLNNYIDTCDIQSLSMLSSAFIKTNAYSEAKVCFQQALSKNWKYLLPVNNYSIMGTDEFDIRVGLNELLKMNNELELHN